MKKTLILWIAASALAGLSSCSYDLSEGCENGTTRCENNRLLVCKNRSFPNEGDACKTDEICLNGKDACEKRICFNDETKCGTGGVHMICKDNAFVANPCIPEIPICLDGKCVACLGSEKRCTNNMIKICFNNSWSTQENCNDLSCSEIDFTCKKINCEANWKRCNDNSVEVCVVDSESIGQYKADDKNACIASYCLENTQTHTTSCVKCTEDEHCYAEKNTPFCHNNTCVACRKDEEKCHATDGSLLICTANGEWPETGGSCPAARECLPNNKGCTDVPKCRDNKDCTSPRPICKGQNMCVECTKDENCPSKDSFCDRTLNICKTELADSTITSCGSLRIDTNQRLAYGQIEKITPASPFQDYAPKLLCGTADQNLKDYRPILNDDIEKLGLVSKTHAQYSANLSSLGNGRHFCVWSFGLEGQKAVACKKGESGGFLKFEEAPKADEVLVYNVIDFEDCVITSVSSEVNVGDGICGTHIKFTNAGLTKIRNEAITGLSIIHSPASTVTLVIPNGIGQFSVDVRKIEATSAQLTVKAKNLSKSSLLTDAMERTTWTETSLDYKDSDEIQIKASGKIVIDNLRWTDFP